MKTVGAFDARTDLADLLDRVERGEEIVITRRGVAVAWLVPVSPRASKDVIRAVIERMDERRRGVRLDGLRVKDLIAEARP
jgi:prevent-host-death family protein